MEEFPKNRRCCFHSQFLVKLFTFRFYHNTQSTAQTVLVKGCSLKIKIIQSSCFNRKMTSFIQILSVISEADNLKICNYIFSLDNRTFYQPVKQLNFKLNVTFYLITIVAITCFSPLLILCSFTQCYHYILKTPPPKKHLYTSCKKKKIGIIFQTPTSFMNYHCLLVVFRVFLLQFLEFIPQQRNVLFNKQNEVKAKF